MALDAMQQVRDWWADPWKVQRQQSNRYFWIWGNQSIQSLTRSYRSYYIVTWEYSASILEPIMTIYERTINRHVAFLYYFFLKGDRIATKSIDKKRVNQRDEPSYSDLLDFSRIFTFLNTINSTLKSTLLGGQAAFLRGWRQYKGKTKQAYYFTT